MNELSTTASVLPAMPPTFTTADTSDITGVNQRIDGLRSEATITTGLAKTKLATARKLQDISEYLALETVSRKSKGPRLRDLRDMADQITQEAASLTSKARHLRTQARVLNATRPVLPERLIASAKHREDSLRIFARGGKTDTWALGLQRKVKQLTTDITKLDLTDEIRKQYQYEIDANKAALAQIQGAQPQFNTAASTNQSCQTGLEPKVELPIDADKEKKEEDEVDEQQSYTDDQAAQQLHGELHILLADGSIMKHNHAKVGNTSSWVQHDISSTNTNELLQLLNGLSEDRQSLEIAVRKRDLDERLCFEVRAKARKLSLNMLEDTSMQADLRKLCELELQTTDGVLSSADVLLDGPPSSTTVRRKAQAEKAVVSAAADLVALRANVAKADAARGETARTDDILQNTLSLRTGRTDAIAVPPVAEHANQGARLERRLQPVPRIRNKVPSQQQSYKPKDYELEFGPKWTLASSKTVRQELETELQADEPRIAGYVVIMRRKASILRHLAPAPDCDQVHIHEEVEALENALSFTELIVDPTKIDLAERDLNENEYRNRGYRHRVLGNSNRVGIDHSRKRQRAEQSERSEGSDVDYTDSGHDMKRRRTAGMRTHTPGIVERHQPQISRISRGQADDSNRPVDSSASVVVISSDEGSDYDRNENELLDKHKLP